MATANDIILNVDVEAAPAAIFEAITTQEGQAAFWTSDCDVSPTTGRFGFPGAEVDVRVEVEAAETGKFVRWHVLGDFPGWEDSTVEWEIGEAAMGGEAGVVLRHTGLTGPFAESDTALGNVAHTWAMILEHLRRYLADGTPAPYFG